MTQVIKSSEARQQWSQLLNKVYRRQARVIVEKSGIPVAAVISAEDLEKFKNLEEQRRKQFEALAIMRDAFKDVPPEEIEREVDKAVAEVRAEMRAEKAASVK